MPDDGAQKVARESASVANQLRRAVDRLLTRHRLAKRLFCDSDGQLTTAAREWMLRLARDNFVQSTTWTGDRDAMLINEGRRRLALQILGSVQLDTERLGALTRMEREHDD